MDSSFLFFIFMLNERKQHKLGLVSTTQMNKVLCFFLKTFKITTEDSCSGQIIYKRLFAHSLLESWGLVSFITAHIIEAEKNMLIKKSHKAVYNQRNCWRQHTGGFFQYHSIYFLTLSVRAAIDHFKSYTQPVPLIYSFIMQATTKW